MVIHVTVEVVLEEFRIELHRAAEHPHSRVIILHRSVHRHPLNSMEFHSHQTTHVVSLKICYRNRELLFVQGSLKKPVLLVLNSLLTLEEAVLVVLGLESFHHLLNFCVSSLGLLGSLLAHSCYIKKKETKAKMNKN